eukprot:3117855-Amphidinium_carterae.1
MRLRDAKNTPADLEFTLTANMPQNSKPATYELRRHAQCTVVFPLRETNAASESGRPTQYKAILELVLASGTTHKTS